MAKKRKLGGVGAVGKAKMKSLHPSEPLRIKYGTGYERDYLDALEILRSDKGKVSARGKIVDRYFVRHPSSSPTLNSRLGEEILLLRTKLQPLSKMRSRRIMCLPQKL